jgi:hypothetical protein
MEANWLPLVYTNCHPISFHVEESNSMSYATLLYPWVIIRQLPNMQNLAVKRFRRRNDADECLRVLRRLSPTEKFIIIFDVSASRGE